jgi:enoyl-CoA hydratase/carnithine racemase
MGNFPVPAPYLASTLAPRRIVEVAVLGSPVGSDEALAAGLLTRVVAPDDLDSAVAAWVDRLRSQPLVASQARRVWQRDLRNAHERSAWVEDMVRKDAAAAEADAEAAAAADAGSADGPTVLDVTASPADPATATGNGATAEAGTHGDVVADGGVAL